MKSFIEHTNEDKDVLDKSPKQVVNEATMGDLLLGLGAAGGIWALKKGWDAWGKGGKLARMLAVTSKQKAQVAKDAEAKRKEKIDTATTILDDPKAKQKDKDKAQADLDKHQTSAEKDKAIVDKDKEDELAKTAKDDAKEIGAKAAQDKFDQSRKKYGDDAQPPKGYSLDPEDKSGTKVIPTADAEKIKADKQQALDKKITAKDPTTVVKKKKVTKKDVGAKYGQAGTSKKSQKKAARKALIKKARDKDMGVTDQFIPYCMSVLSDLTEDFTKEDRTQLLEELVLEETMTLQESNELQAIMALDDAGIKADINKKGQIVVKKKDLKKAEKALKKSFRKGGEPKLVGEEVLEDGTDRMVREYKKDTPGQVKEGFGIYSPRSAWEVVSKARARIIEAVDAAAARELYLFMQNERSLMRQRDSIIKNISRKMKSGKYDHKQAPKLWMHWVTNGAKEYDNLYSSPGAKTFDKETKMSVAIQLADEYKAEIELGNYS